MGINNSLGVFQSAKEYVIKNSYPPSAHAINVGDTILVWKHFPSVMNMLQTCIAGRVDYTTPFPALELNKALKEYVNYHPTEVKEVTSNANAFYSMYIYPGATLTYHNRIAIYLHDKIQYSRQHGMYLAWSTLWF